MSARSDHSPELRVVVTNTLIVADIKRSVAFYRDVLGGTVLREGEPSCPYGHSGLCCASCRQAGACLSFCGTALLSGSGARTSCGTS